MASTKPMVLVIPGAWHPPIAYAPILDALGISALDADVATLPSFNPRDHFTPACTADAKAVREKILSLLDDATRDVLLLIHSYGGIPAGGAAHGLSKRARAREGKTTGVVGLIYMAAFVVPEGQTLKDFLGGRHAPYVVQNSPSTGHCVPTGARNVFFNDLTDSAAAYLEESLRPHSQIAFESAAPAPAWAEPDYAGKLAFLRCTQDQALPTFVQDMFIEKSGVEWIVMDMNCGHSPWASKPEEVIENLKELLPKLEA